MEIAEEIENVYVMETVEWFALKSNKCIWLHLPIGLWTKISRKEKENSEPTINGRVLFLNLTLRVMYLT